MPAACDSTAELNDASNAAGVALKAGLLASVVKGVQAASANTPASDVTLGTCTVAAARVLEEAPRRSLTTSNKKITANYEVAVASATAASTMVTAVNGAKAAMQTAMLTEMNTQVAASTALSGFNVTGVTQADSTATTSGGAAASTSGALARFGGALAAVFITFGAIMV
jgi:hypothetical protein